MYSFYRVLGHVLSPFFKLKELEPARKGELPRADIWLHGASVGEANVAAAILYEFFARNPKAKGLLTLQTKTGVLKAKELLKDYPVAISLAPFDVPSFAKKAAYSVRPRIFGLIETELWPNLIYENHLFGAKLFILNGRISAKSFPKYRYVTPLMRRLFGYFSQIAVIGPEEKERFLALGAPREKVFIAGNAKYDILERRRKDLSLGRLKKIFPDKKKLFTFGSIRSGEEKIIVRVVAALSRKFPDVCFVLVPRHLSLITRLKNFLKKEAIYPTLFSELKHQRSSFHQSQIIIVDEIGPLFGIYALSCGAFVGASLCAKGGQNPLEPACFKKPIIFGPHMENFSYEARSLVEAGGAIMVTNQRELEYAVEILLKDETQNLKTGLNAYRVYQKFLGASRSYAELLTKNFNC